MPNAAFSRPLTPSPELAAVIGSASLPRTEVVKRVWAYIRNNNLQDPADKRTIVADDKLRAVIGERCSMFDLMKKLSAHLEG